MQGIIVTPSGDIWAVDQGKSPVVHLPRGTPPRGRFSAATRGRTHCTIPAACSRRFTSAIDQQDRIWVTNNIGVIGDPLPRLRSDQGREIRGRSSAAAALAIDSKGNVWVANRFGSSERGRLQDSTRCMAAYARQGREGGDGSPRAPAFPHRSPAFRDGGSVTVLQPDGSQAPFSPVAGKGLAGPWAVAIDGNDNAWVSNLVVRGDGHRAGVWRSAGDCPPGQKSGDAISPPGGCVGGGMQQLVDIGIGPAGDVVGHQQLAESTTPRSDWRRGPQHARRRTGPGGVLRHGQARDRPR